MAVVVDAHAAIRNFTALAAAGGEGPYGFYESLDYTPSRVLTGTHAVVRSLAPRGVPQWLNEGLAVMMERGGAPAPTEPDAAVLPLARLEGPFDGLSPDEARSAYATSAAAAQALLDRAGPMVIYNLLTNLGAGMRFDEAFERAALVPYREFQQTWR